jgi:hypothetical protein
MRNIVDAMQVAFYGVGIVVLLLIALWGYQSNERMQREHEQSRIMHDRMLKDHVQQLKDHERTMERLAGGAK